MTREQFLELVKNPAQSVTTESIAALAGQFPYCQPLRYLYLKKLAESESVQYPQQLKITAALSPDRTRLFRFIHPEPVTAGTEDLMAGVYTEPVEDATTASAAVDSILPFENNTIGNDRASATDTPEYEAPQEETRMTVEEIVNQRLKELNLWQETEEQHPTAEETIAAGVETSGLHSEDGLTTAAEVPVFEVQEHDHPPLHTPAPPEEPAAEVHITEIHSTAIPSINEDETEVLQSAARSDQEKTSAHLEADPLEEILQESIAETRLRNLDYFENNLAGEPAITTASDEVTAVHTPPGTPDDNHSSGDTETAAHPAAIQTTPENSPSEKYAEHTSEIHSFTEWLKLNQKTQEPAVSPDIAEKANGPIQVLQTTIRAEENTAISGNTAALNQATAPPEAEIQKEAPVTGSLTEGLSEKGVSGTDHPSPLATGIRFLYIKSGNDTAIPATPPVISVETTAAQVTITPAPTEVQLPSFEKHVPGTGKENPSPSLPAEPISVTPVEAAPAEGLFPADPSQETIFTGEIIPPRKPIPDPSLVDTDPPKPKVPSKDLIDKFIQEEPRITPSKSTFYSPANMAKKSVIEPDDLVTETLANIYAQQGNYQKAINFYQKLSLKFPEKSRYFAALIEELKKKSNS